MFEEKLASKLDPLEILPKYVPIHEVRQRVIHFTGKDEIGARLARTSRK